MPARNLERPLYIVDAGPCPGVYFDKEGYERVLQQKGISLEMEIFMPTTRQRTKFKRSFQVADRIPAFPMNTENFRLLEQGEEASSVVPLDYAVGAYEMDGYLEVDERPVVATITYRMALVCQATRIEELRAPSADTEGMVRIYLRRVEKE